MIEQFIILGKKTIGQIGGWTWLILLIFGLGPFFKKYFGKQLIHPKLLLFIIGFIIPSLDDISTFIIGAPFSHLSLFSSFLGVLLVYLFFIILFKYQLAIFVVFGQLSFLAYEFIFDSIPPFFPFSKVTVGLSNLTPIPLIILKAIIYPTIIFFLLVSVYLILHQEKKRVFDYSTAEAAIKYEKKRFEGAGGENITRQEQLILLNFLKDFSSLERIADIGAGTGRMSTFILEKIKPIELILVDNSQEMLKVAKKKIETLTNKNSLIKYIIAKAEDLPLEDNSIDCVVSYHVVKHLLEPDKFLNEVARVLSAQGVAVIEMTNKYSLVRLRGEGAHLYSKNEFSKLCQQAGLKIKDYKGCNIFGETVIKLCPGFLQQNIVNIDKFLTFLFPGLATKLIFCLTKN